MRRGRRLGVDVGTVRIGVAICDPDGLIATPLETVPRSTDAASDARRILALGADADLLEVIVGEPLALSGRQTASTEDALAFARELSRAGTVPVRLVDERLSTRSAQSALHERGRSVKRSRSVIDQAAAVVILQHALETERATGRPPGRSTGSNHQEEAQA